MWSISLIAQFLLPKVQTRQQRKASYTVCIGHLGRLPSSKRMTKVPLWKLSRETPCSYSRHMSTWRIFSRVICHKRNGRPKEFCSCFPKPPRLPSSTERACHRAGSFYSCQETIFRAEGYQQNTNKLHFASKEVRSTNCSLAASPLRAFETMC